LSHCLDNSWNLKTLFIQTNTVYIIGCWTRGYEHKTVCHSKAEYARDEDGDGFCEVHVNTQEGIWSLLRSWLRPHRGISQDNMPIYLGFFEFMHNVRKRGKAILEDLFRTILAPDLRKLEEFQPSS